MTHNTHTPATTYFEHYISGEVQSLEEWQAEDFTSEWLAECEYHDASEPADQPAQTTAEMIQDYISLGYLVEVRRTETQAEKDIYGNWMDAK